MWDVGDGRTLIKDQWGQIRLIEMNHLNDLCAGSIESDPIDPIDQR
jgi:hypothetical protein